jgi:hypothetical protein
MVSVKSKQKKKEKKNLEEKHDRFIQKLKFIRFFRSF